MGWEMAVRIEKIVAAVLHEAHEWQEEEVMEMLSEGPEDSTNTGRDLVQAALPTVPLVRSRLPLGPQGLVHVPLFFTRERNNERLLYKALL
jgi:hypothetical protein